LMTEAREFMNTPCGLLLARGGVQAEQVKEALDRQGGPAWDHTVFRLLAEVDVASLVLGEPHKGPGTGISLASSGWWFRHADDFAQRLAALSGQEILALVSGRGLSGFHLARPDGSHERKLSGENEELWFEGARLFLGEDLNGREHPSLGEIAFEVHGDDPVGAQLPGLFNFGLSEETEQSLLVRFRGAALQAGYQWKPGEERDPDEVVPTSMRGLSLASAVRLPGPPRWARATRAHAIRRAEKVLREDGWLCLVPQVDGELCSYGTAVRILQLAPMADGSALGLLHPRAAVKINSVEGSTISLEVIEEVPAADGELLARHVERAIELLPIVNRDVEFDADELLTSSNPALLLGWQLNLSPEQCQRYLEDGDAAARMGVLVEVLEQAAERIEATVAPE
jgi:hypothetical protein